MKLDVESAFSSPAGQGGIGLAIPPMHFLAKRAKVAITGRRSAVLSTAVEALRRNGGSVVGIVADVATEEGRALTLHQALDALGGLDILINNAGGVRAGRLEATFAEGDRDDAERRRSRGLTASPSHASGAAGAPRERRRHGCECHVGYRADWRTVLRHIRCRQGGSRPIWRVLAPRIEGRRGSCPDRLSRWDRHANDENESGRTGARVRARASVGRR